MKSGRRFRVGSVKGAGGLDPVFRPFEARLRRAPQDEQINFLVLYQFLRRNSSS
jgi:hypothetical protein